MSGEMADTKAHLADTTDEDCSVTATQYRTSLEISNHTSCIGLRPSPYPVYLSIILVFITSSINTMLVSESVIYNKVCYEKLENVTLCSNLTFSKDHPLLQVCQALSRSPRSPCVLLSVTYMLCWICVIWLYSCNFVFLSSFSL